MDKAQSVIVNPEEHFCTLSVEQRLSLLANVIVDTILEDQRSGQSPVLNRLEDGDT